MTNPFYRPLPDGCVPATEAVPIGPLETRRARRARMAAAEATLRRSFDDLDAALAGEDEAGSDAGTRTVVRVSVLLPQGGGVAHRGRRID